MEEEYADIYYVDTRNAPPVVRDNRPGSTRGPTWMPGRRPVTHQYVPRPQMGSYQSQMVPYQSAPQVIYATPPQATAATLLGKLTTGQIVEMVAQIFAALQSLPGAPVATRDVGTDVSNLILYQGALASHAKRDEQVRTLGSLVARLVG